LPIVQSSPAARWAGLPEIGPVHDLRVGPEQLPTSTRCLVMGVVNVTPDSFSEGGAHAGTEAAVAHALDLAAAGADLLDVGGESTRPGAAYVDEAVELARVVPVVLRLAALTEVPISVDTRKAAVALAALAAGAAMVNDVSAGRDDPALLPAVAEAGVPVVLMHMQGTPATMQDDPRYDDVVGEVEAFLAERCAAAKAAGVAADALVVDPGIGFGKRDGHNYALLAASPGSATRCWWAPAARGSSAGPSGARPWTSGSRARPPPWSGRWSGAPASCACTTSARWSAPCA